MSDRAKQVPPAQVQRGGQASNAVVPTADGGATGSFEHGDANPEGAHATNRQGGVA
jgi:hypothetical protein